MKYRTLLIVLNIPHIPFVCKNEQVKERFSRLRHYATSRNVVGSNPDEVIGFLNFPNPSIRTVALGPTQPLIEMSTRNLPGGKGLSARKADNHTAICDPIV
jgi:hypothetical protein